ncbi:MAG: LytTR family transcriptional regulator DNA-binding domain-containing protein [Bacteroidota bacterium]
MRQKLNRPYDLIENKTFRFIFVFGGSIFGMIFLWIFEPYGFYKLSNYEKLRALGFYFGAGLIPLILQFYVFQDILIKKYTLLNTILWIVLSSILLSISGGIVNSILFNNGKYVIFSVLYFLWIIPSIQVIPISIIILLHYNWSLKKHLRLAVQVNSTLKHEKNTQVSIEKIAEINSDNKNESFKISLDSLLFLVSVENYIEVYLIENGNVNKKLVRYSLLRVEQDNMEIDELFRCHKSYIVNKNKIESILGNAAGYKLKLYDYDEQIPVSRKLNKEIQNVLIN